MHTAVRRRCMDYIKLLLEHGASPDEQDNERRTPLHFAAERGSLEVVDLLLNRFASPDEQDNEGRLPRDLTIQRRNIPKICLLLDHKADPKQKTSLHVAAQYGDDFKYDWYKYPHSLMINPGINSLSTPKNNGYTDRQ